MFTKKIKTVEISLRLIIVGFPLIYFVCLTSAFAQGNHQTDLERDGLKGSVRKVEEYYISYPKNGAPAGTPKLTRIATYDSDGHQIETIGLADMGDNSYYSRYVFGFDTKGRRVLIEHYESSKGKYEDIFLPGTPENQTRVLNPRFSEKLLTKTVSKFSEDGKLREVIISDGTGELESESIYTYDPKTKESKTIVRRNGEIVAEYKAFYKLNGRRQEVIGYQNSVPFSKGVFYFDKKRRIVYQEHIGFKPAPDGINRIEMLEHKHRQVINGKININESVNFDSSGAPSFKYVLRSKNNLQRLRTYYKYQAAGSDTGNSADESKWLFQNQLKTDYRFDKHGNWIKSVEFKQEGSNRRFYETYGMERIITYDMKN